MLNLTYTEQDYSWVIDMTDEEYWLYYDRKVAELGLYS